MKPVWQARTGGPISPLLQAIGDSTTEDVAFLPFDIQSSIAHVMGLQHVGLVKAEEAKQLIDGLTSLPDDLPLDPALEDVHMNIEAALTESLGEIGKRLHTGRSRNDQVATCIALYCRHHLVAAAKGIHRLVEVLAAKVDETADTAWIAKTHGQAAQPATIAFLLHAHATRLLGRAHWALANATAITSPLGSGAIAGSTLPLDPAFTARLLGMEPAPNALLATGSRDVVTDALGILAKVGDALADLAHDLLALGPQMHLAPAHTTGSSLMPHKRNPDALELLRGGGRALQGHLASATAVTTGLGLGYQRDLQLTKPPLLAFSDLHDLLSLAAEVIEGAIFKGASLDDRGLLATDLAEALVTAGMPFRDAYREVAAVYANVEAGAPFAEAVAALDLPVVPLAADPANRTTFGAPANLPALRPPLDALAQAIAPVAAACAKSAALPEVSW